MSFLILLELFPYPLCFHTPASISVLRFSCVFFSRQRVLGLLRKRGRRPFSISFLTASLPHVLQLLSFLAISYRSGALGEFGDSGVPDDHSSYRFPVLYVLHWDRRLAGDVRLCRHGVYRWIPIDDSAISRKETVRNILCSYQWSSWRLALRQPHTSWYMSCTVHVPERPADKQQSNGVRRMYTSTTLL